MSTEYPVAMSDGIASRELILVAVSVVALSVVASFGFNALTTNPLVPESTLTIADAPEPARLNQSGDTPMVVVTHEGGETIPLETLEIVIGSRADGVSLSAANDWSTTVSGVTYEARLDGERIRIGATMRPADTLVVRRTDGTLTVAGFQALVRVFHRPSDAVIARETVDIR